VAKFGHINDIAQNPASIAIGKNLAVDFLVIGASEGQKSAI
jgi:hypothetical protein